MNTTLDDATLDDLVIERVPITVCVCTEHVTERSELAHVVMRGERGFPSMGWVEVRYLAPRIQTFRDLWIVRLDDEGRCVEFEEWPFWPSGTRGGFHPGLDVP